MIRDIAHGLCLSGLGWLGDALSRSAGAVLCLHSVVEGGATARSVSGLTITDDFLERLIVDLRQRGIAFVSLDEALRRRSGTDDGKPFVALTFDDGCRDNHDVAFPVLRRHEVPFTIFLTTGFLDGDLPLWWLVLDDVIGRNPRVALDDLVLPSGTRAEKRAAFALADRYCRQKSAGEIAGFVERLVTQHRSGMTPADIRRLALDWSMVRGMLDSGLAAFGGHTVTHPMLSRLTTDAIAAEVAGCRDRLLDETGLRPAYFAYPYGQDCEVGSAAPCAVQSAGFAAAFTTVRTVLRASDLYRPYQLPRISIDSRSQSEVIVRAYLSGLPHGIQQALRSIRTLGASPKPGALTHAAEG